MITGEEGGTTRPGGKGEPRMPRIRVERVPAIPHGITAFLEVAGEITAESTVPVWVLEEAMTEAEARLLELALQAEADRGPQTGTN